MDTDMIEQIQKSMDQDPQLKDLFEPSSEENSKLFMD